MNNTYRNTEKQYPGGGVFREYPRKKMQCPILSEKCI